MPVDSQGKLLIYCLNIGQGDTTIVVTPENKVIIIDAYIAKKVISALESIGLVENDPIDHIVVSHPHYDHYNAVVPLLNFYNPREITLSSLKLYEKNIAGYIDIINTTGEKDPPVPVNYLSGYKEIYPDKNKFTELNPLRFDLLGPSNQLIAGLARAKKLNINHYSIIAGLKLKKFRMIIAGDAQMENWAHYDREQMLEEKCTVLRAAHHGSANGTQFERLSRLAPRVIIVSSEPWGKDDLPDLIGCVSFLRYANGSSDPIVALTDETGSIKIEVSPSGRHKVFSFPDKKKDDIVDLSSSNPTRLPDANNSTDWELLTIEKMPP